MKRRSKATITLNMKLFYIYNINQYTESVYCKYTYKVTSHGSNPSAARSHVPSLIIIAEAFDLALLFKYNKLF